MRYHRNSKSLLFNGQTYTAVSGPHGEGELSTGDYSIQVRNAVEGDGLDSPYCAGGVCFFIPIAPLFDSNGRRGFGIHPDGNMYGTKGCIGIKEIDARAFLMAWKKLGVGNRPTTLKVLD